MSGGQRRTPPAPGVWGRASGVVACLAVTGNQAVVSGVITHGALGDGSDLSGATATLTLVDDPAQDIAGFVFSFWGVPIVPCEPVFPFVALDEGNITVHA